MKVTRLPFDPGPAAWNEILPAPISYGAIDENTTADVVIIGAGFAGLSAARRLNQLDSKAKIIVLDARRVAEGPAGRNSGFMIDLPHNLASKDYAGGIEVDKGQTRMNREAIAFAREAKQEFSMSDEAFIESGKVNAAATGKGVKHNLDYADHLTALGEKHEILDAEQMQDICGSSYYENGLFTPGTALLQPALYIRNLAAGIVGNGVVIHENSPVTSLEQSAMGWEVQTANASINAQKVILATNGHVESFGFFERRLIHIYLYASMTKPLTLDATQRLSGQPRWAFTPADPLGTTVRKTSGLGGDRIIVRNRFTWAPNRTVSEARLTNIAKTHDKSFADRFPALAGVGMDYRWGGLLCLSWNSVPAFGELEPGLFSACCQNGLGTAMGTLSGKLIAELIMNKSSQSLQTMQSYPQPQRLPPEPFASIGGKATLRWGELKAGREI